MEILTQKISQEVVVVTPQGRFDAFSAPDVRERFEQLLNDEGILNFAVDLSQTTFLDSAGIAVLVSLLKQTRQKGGDVNLVWPNTEAARRILTLTRFDKIFSMFDTLEMAVESFLCRQAV